MAMIIGITGEKVRVRNAGSISQDFEQLLRKVYSFCKKTFARGCQIFLEESKRNIGNLNRVCKKPAPSLFPFVKQY